MENQNIQVNGEMEIEEFPDEFQCCVCLDLMYKPVVLACGHISCFWCVFKAMDTFQESHCPVCRNPYNHFPRICGLLHFLLLKLYSSDYKRRERQVAEEESEYGHASPQFQDGLLDFRSNKLLDVRDASSPLLGAVSIDPKSIIGDSSLVQDSLEKTSPCVVDKTAPPTSSISETTNEVNCMIKSEDRNEICKQVSVIDFQCAVCTELLFRPVVLNCGHVYCEACINKLHDSVFRCPLCQSLHPNGFPNVCLVLDHFLEEHFAQEYSARKESSAKLQRASTSGSSTQKQDQTAQGSSVPTHVYSSWWSGHGFEVHPGVGCDYCGICPIIGARYKCKDCVEEIGFDLCESCYRSSSKLPGRFNQQHTQDHQFVNVRPPVLRNLIVTPENSDEYISIFTPPHLPYDGSDDDDLENQDNQPAT